MYLSQRLPGERRMRWAMALGLLGAVLIGLGLGVALATARDPGRPTFAPAASDYTDRLTAQTVPADQPGASTGSWTVDCGRNLNGHRNADNLVAQPGVAHGAMHLHDYVGNLATDAFRSNAQLAAAGTTCAGGDRSTYYWPVLRLIGAGSGPPSPPEHRNTGRILLPAGVLVQYRGNPSSAVVAMPAFLRASTGNVRAITQHGLNTGHVRWGCSGRPGAVTLHYPRCHSGERVVRTADYPNCWDGRRIDSPTHRAHLVFPDVAGTCPPDTFAVPQLRVQLTYPVPAGVDFAIDTMPAERRAAVTDHFDFISVMPEPLMRQVVACVNSGRTCTAG